jgi:hypothetical protein
MGSICVSIANLLMNVAVFAIDTHIEPIVTVALAENGAAGVEAREQKEQEDA